MTEEQDLELLTNILISLMAIMQNIKEDTAAANQCSNYKNMYNTIILILTNIDFRLYSQSESTNNIFTLIRQILAFFTNCPFDEYFKNHYLLEQGELTNEQFHEVYDDFQATEDIEKYTFYDEINCCKIELGDIIANSG